MFKEEENLIILCEQNAVVEGGGDGNVDNGERERERLIPTQQLTLIPTDGQHPKTGRYRINLILTRQTFSNEIKQCKTYPGAQIDNDGNLV